VRLFQNSVIYPAYRARLAALRRPDWPFARQLTAFLADGYGAPHFLLPVVTRDSSAFFTNSDDESLQRQWAREHGLPARMAGDDILLAQIEEHRTEVFYNLDPMRYQSNFVRRLPGTVRHAIAWRAAPSPGADFAAYAAIVCNFPSILEGYRQRGWRTAYFAPSFHPLLERFAANSERPVDILFVGGYSRHHRRRAQLLETIAGLRGRFKVQFHLDRSRLTRLAESLPGRLLPLSRERRPAAIRAVSRPGLFGMDLYDALSRAKIVLNGAIDMAGNDRGNLRCFEAMGCGALMVSDQGVYPDGMEDGRTLLTYADPEQALNVIEAALGDPVRRLEIAGRGAQLMRTEYGKGNQWQAFQRIVEAL
jgi:hypothetical protein